MIPPSGSGRSAPLPATGVVPDIYAKATAKDGWVQLATDLKVDERVRLIGAKEEGIHEVLEVTKDGFRTGFKPAGDEVFVYGREVKDFRTVDYEAIAMLNVSATQEIHRLLEKKDADIAALKKQLAEQAAKEKALEASLAGQAAREKSIEARLARIEAHGKSIAAQEKRFVAQEQTIAAQKAQIRTLASHRAAPARQMEKIAQRIDGRDSRPLANAGSDSTDAP